MTDLATTEAPVSTTLDPTDTTGASGGGTPALTPDEPAKEPAKVSLRDAVAAEFKADKDAKPEPKEEAAAKDGDAPKGKEGEEKGEPVKEGKARREDGKFAPKVEAKAEAEPDAEANTDAKQDEPAPKQDDAKPRTGHIDPPKNFLPDARETWRNTPRAVQRDVADTIARHEAEVTQYREVAERYAPLREYDELVRQNGRAGLHETLAEVKQLEDLMERNPIAALNQVLQRAGPRKADGSAVSLYEVAQHIVQAGPDGYQRMAAVQQQQQEPREDPRVAQLQQQLHAVQAQTLSATVIEPFKAAHPRYDELKDDIAFFLQSGKVPSSLSVPDRLAAAYDMAVRINPPSHGDDATAQTDPPEPADRVAPDSSGSKSIKSAPGAVSTDMEPERGGSIRDLLAAELKRSKGSR